MAEKQTLRGLLAIELVDDVLFEHGPILTIEYVLEVLAKLVARGGRSRLRPFNRALEIVLTDELREDVVGKDVILSLLIAALAAPRGVVLRELQEEIDAGTREAFSHR